MSCRLQATTITCAGLFNGSHLTHGCAFPCCRYGRSRNELEMAGKEYTDAEVKLCAPITYLNGSTSKPIFPCGLNAWSTFNDTYSLYVEGRGRRLTPVAVSEKGIALSSDVANRYVDEYPTNFNQPQQVSPRSAAADRSSRHW